MTVGLHSTLLYRVLAWAMALAVVPMMQGCTSDGGLPPEEDSAAEEISDFTEAYQLGAGDALTVNVWRNPELSVSVPVRPDGRISLPLTGDVDVGGKTPEEVASVIQNALSEFVRDPQVTVIVTQVGSTEYLNRVRVTGAVRSPLSTPYRPGMTVMDVVLDAGGPTEFANGDGARLYRQGQAVRAVKLEALLQRGDLSTNFSLRPGDVITVPESAF